MTNSATETKSMGLRADAQLAAFLPLFMKSALTRNLLTVYQDSHVRELYFHETTPYRLPGPDSYREAKNSQP